ncbi:MAG: putative metalloprotease CJM1_0395 family protein, partial [Myxococcota bacterium]
MGQSSVAFRPLIRGATAAPVPEDQGGADGGEALTKDEQREVQELKARDREVRVHEQAHIAASGSLSTAGPFYEYETGPDGRRYVVGGEVKVSAPKGRDPEETIQIQEQLIRAALAPAEPSAQDRRVAAGARRKISEAKLEQAE